MMDRRYLKTLLLINLRELGALRGSTLLQALFMLLNNLVFFTFWIILYSNVDQIRGFYIKDIAFVFAAAAAGFGIAFAFFGGTLHLADAINQGKLDVYLTQPRDVLLQALTARTMVSGWGDAASSLVLMLWYFGFEPAAWLYFGVSAVSATILFVSAVTLFQSLIFWLPRSERLSEQLLEFLLTFSLYPNTVFSGPVRALTYTLIPAAFISFLPAIARLHRQPQLAALCVLASLVYLLIARTIFALGLKRYESGNSFVSTR